MDWNLLVLGLTGGFTVALLFTGGRNFVRESAIQTKAYRDVARGDPHATRMVLLEGMLWDMDQEHEQRRKTAWAAHQRALAGEQEAA